MSRKSFTVKSAHLEDSPLHLFHRLGQGAADAFSSQVREVDLTPRQFAVLSAAAHNDGLSQTDLVALTGVDRSTMADIVKRMLKKGLLQRQRTKWDARVYAIRLTEAGRSLVKSVAPAAKKVDNQLLEPLGSQERREVFIRDLKVVLQGMT